MPAVITDQFRILNASNFIDTVTGIGASDPTNSFYVTLGLPNAEAVGFGRTSNFNDVPPAPIDNINTNNHIGDTTLFGKRVTGKNVRRLIRRVDWTQGTRYEMYRHDYSINSRSPVTQSARLYDANYYVMNENFNVYICIDNGSSGINTTGNASQDQPTFTDLEPSKAGESGDGYIWKFLYTVSPSDIIKFDSTEFIAVPNDWSTSTDAVIQAVRENGDSELNNNQIKKVYIENQGAGYTDGTGQEVAILGDGEGGKVVVDVVNGKVTNAVVSSGGKGYSYGMVDLGAIGNTSAGTKANLIPIIPPSKGHGHDIYKELGSDRVLVFARFDTSTTNDFPTNTSFSQIGILKNPTSIGSTSIFTDPTFSSVGALKFLSVNGVPTVGNSVSQVVSGGTAKGFVAAYDVDTQVLKFVQDRSNVLNPGSFDTVDYIGVSTDAKVHPFESNTNPVNSSGFQGSIDTGFTGVSTNPSGTKLISLDTQFTQGVSNPEINKKSGDIVYLDNRPLITRNARQKEDVKIILEF